MYIFRLFFYEMILYYKVNKKYNQPQEDQRGTNRASACRQFFFLRLRKDHNEIKPHTYIAVVFSTRSIRICFLVNYHQSVIIETHLSLRSNRPDTHERCQFSHAPVLHNIFF